ncbi:hypothetical protein CRUP_030769 [Coryphaenoides rupestris]|nr:hypothetical protein CRUP_030769 [Coryphaenoides rupestris]
MRRLPAEGAELRGDLGAAPESTSPPPQSQPPQSQPAYSYYPDDEFQHFYRWTSPPGIIKIMAVIVIVLSLGVFACVASTLAWDTQGGLAGFGGTGGYGAGGYGGGGYGGGSNYGSFGGGAYGAGNSYGYGGIGGNDPRKGKGFMIAMAAITFIMALVVFIIIVSHQNLCQSRRFYLAVLILCAILALLMLIASIVYLVAVNPMAQSSSSIYAVQIQGLCAQYQQPAQTGVFVNQYLYHYCVVEPQEAIAVVCGFLVTAALIVMLVFALKTRQKIRGYWQGDNILWKESPPGDVEAWELDDLQQGSPQFLDALDEYNKLKDFKKSADYQMNKRRCKYLKGKLNHIKKMVDKELDDLQQGSPQFLDALDEYNKLKDFKKSADYQMNKRRCKYLKGKLNHIKKMRPGGPGPAPPHQRRPVQQQLRGAQLHRQAQEEAPASGTPARREFPRITNEDMRVAYKREFDRDHQEYKDLQAELDAVNRKLSDVDKELDDLQQGSPQFLDALDEYNKLKDFKKSADYQMNKRRCKYLKGKLNHIKKMVSDFDRA